MNILAINNYSLEECLQKSKSKISPRHHNWGVDYLMQKGHNISLLNYKQHKKRDFSGLWFCLKLLPHLNRYDVIIAFANPHVGNNVRLLLINNGKGNEFRNYDHPCYFLGEEADRFVAAAGHYGNKSHCLVKDYATDLGYEYLSASNKEEFNAVIDSFLTPKITDKPMLLEVFTETEDESNALEQTLNIITDSKYMMKQKVKQMVKDFIGNENIEVVKKS